MAAERSLNCTTVRNFAFAVAHLYAEVVICSSSQAGDHKNASDCCIQVVVFHGYAKAIEYSLARCGRTA
jgi:hypothetical protein